MRCNGATTSRRATLPRGHIAGRDGVAAGYAAAMPTLRFETPVPFPVEVVRAYHERPGALRRLMPPWDGTEIVEQIGAVGEGDRVVLRVPPGVRWVAVHHALPDGFVDEMAEGPLGHWRHSHRFVADGQNAVVIDEIDYGPSIWSPVVDGGLKKMFAWRKGRIAEDLSRHAGQTPRRFLLAGASGLIGTQLAAFLRTGGHEVVQLVRRGAGVEQIEWDPGRGRLDPASIEGFDAVISLSGENVAEGSWTPARREQLRSSRLGPTSLLARTFALLQRPPKAWVSASAVGIYGTRGDERLDERAAPGGGFLAGLCQEWEAAAETVPAVRVVKARIGVVLSARGGALAKMRTPFLAGVGGPLGDGRQYFPWIAMDDVVYALAQLALDEGFVGPVNLVSPEPARQIEFAGALGKALWRPAFMPLPALAVTTLFGDMGKEALLGSQLAVPAALAPRFRFAQPSLSATLAHELGVA